MSERVRIQLHLRLVYRSNDAQTVTLSMIFKWYEEDFGVNLFGYIRQFLSDEKRSRLETAVAEHYTVLCVTSLGYTCMHRC